ncbi:HIRAN domain-containing protein [Sphingomonas jinjuensis]|uniref:HIRAN domain-containing protein n=1 Tax=Sphingomonas jinjuensis TaxID=535907 RepID=UPI001FE48536|nr:HIRAN domain-containing protein [Sphingomonas jinjuensis]
MSLAVVGADHPNKRGPARRFELALCLQGEEVDLVPEPKNPVDEHAIAVFSARGVQLGYLTAERAPWIGGMLKNGREIAAVFQAQASFGAWIRVAFDGEKPFLPSIAAAPPPPEPVGPRVERDFDWGC